MVDLTNRVAEPTVVWVLATLVGGLTAAISVPALARALPSRSDIDAAQLATWSAGQRVGLAAGGGLILGSALLRFPDPIDVALLALSGIVLLTSAAVDLRTNRLPDRLSALAMLTVALAGTVAAGDRGSMVVVQLCVGAALFAGILELVHALQPAGMGRGDVKFAVVLGALLGIAASSTEQTVRLVVAALVGAIVLTLSCAAIVAVHRRVALAAVPFGPGLAAASWAAAVTAG